jgi:hypothetical protein
LSSLFRISENLNRKRKLSERERERESEKEKENRRRKRSTEETYNNLKCCREHTSTEDYNSQRFKTTFSSRIFIGILHKQKIM